MNMPLPKTTQGVYRLSVSTFYFLQGLVFASWASRIPDIKSALGLNDADLGSVLFAVPVYGAWRGFSELCWEQPWWTGISLRRRTSSPFS